MSDVELVERAIDEQLVALRRELLDGADDTQALDPETAWRFIRAGYVKGYMDALEKFGQAAPEHARLTGWRLASTMRARTATAVRESRERRRREG